MKRLFKKLTKKAVIAVLAIIVLIVPLLYLSLLNSREAQASWFDDNWAFRKAIILTDTAAETNKYATLSGYDASDTTKYQTDCGDVRFTDQNGNVLTYTVTSCGAATTFHINMDSIILGTQTIYLYYGNPSASDGFVSTDPYSACAGCTFGSPASEEKTPSPILYWKFDDATDTTAQDSSANNLDGTLNNTPTWQTEDFCISSKCLWFDGTNNENVSKSDDAKLDFAAADNFTVQAWVKRNGVSSANNFILTKAQSGYTGYKLYQDASGDYCFDVSDGTNTDTACTSAVEFDDDKWHLVQGVKTGTTNITLYVDGNQRAQDASIAATGTLANTGTFYSGVDLDGTSNEWLGFIDEVKVYPYARSASQIQADFNSKDSPANKGSGVILGSAATPGSTLSDGLVGYWKMDESSGNATDSSGNSLTLTNNNTTSYAAAKFGNGGSFTAASLHYFSTATTISGVKTVAFWVNPTSNSDDFINLTASAYINSGSGTVSATGFTSPSIYVNGVLNGTITASAWNHVVVTTDTGIDANAYEAGRANSAYADGKMDELRVYSRALSPAEVSQLYTFAPGPVAQWKMEEGTGTTISDSSGNANTSSAFTGDVAWTQGKYGKGLTFDGANDAVPIPETTYTDLGATTDSYTISAWMKTTTNFSGAGGAIVSKNLGDGSSYPFQLYLNSSEFACFALLAPSAVPSTCGSTALNDGKWHYLTGVRDVATDLLYIYVDGVQINSTTDTSTSSAANNENIYIGTNTGLGTDFNGQIDDAKIYNYARTPGQVIEDMNAGHPAPGSPVGSAVGYWKFDEGYSTTANDSSINLNSLTLSSASWTNAGKFGKAWNGTGAIWASRADDADLDFSATDDFSISGWFKSDSATNPSAIEYLVNKASSVIQGYAVYANTSGNLCFGIDDDTTWTPDIASCTTTDVYDATWHHFTAVRDTVQDKTYIYVDSQQKDSNTDSTTATLANSLSLYVGDRDGVDNGDEFNGDLDEVKIYRSALTADEVKLDFNRSSSLVLGALSDTTSGNQAQSAASEYCIPGDSTSCDGPVAQWKMEEGTGTTINDSAGNANTSSAFTGNVAWVPGKFGKGLYFDGVNDVVRIPETSSTDLGATTDSYTVGAWIKTSTGTLPSYILAKDDGSTLTAPIRLYLTGVGKPDFQILQASPLQAPGAVGPTSLVDGKWHYVVGVRDVTADTLYIYVDGVRAGSANDTTTVSTANDDDISIGNAGASYTAYDFNGTIDQVRIYNYARSAAQIAWDYNKGAPVAHWKMDECQGTAVNDSSGNSFTGTLTVGASGEDTAGNCATSSTAWGSGATGKVNYSLSLDGTDDYVATSAFSPLARAAQTTAKFSWGGWFYPTTSAASKTLLEKATEFQLTTDANSMPICGVYYSAGFHNSTAPTQGLTLSAWNHILCVYDGTNINTYLNGKLIKQSSETNNVTAVSSILYMGETSGGANRYSGQIDEAKVFNYALTATQVKTLYNGGAVRFGPVSGAP